MKFDECKTCGYYKKIKKTLDILDQRVKCIKPPPGEIPRIPGIDIYGEILPVEGATGGDHIVYIDFNKRYDLDARIDEVEKKWEEDIREFPEEEWNRNARILKKKKAKEEMIGALNANRTRAGVLVADVRGHDESSSFIVGMLHQSFLTGALYELEINGKITTGLFEKLNTRFYNSSSVDDFFTMIYGEILDNGKFLFISAGHPAPLVFSRKFDCFMDIPPGLVVNYPPIGIMPSGKDIDATLNKSVLGYKQEYTVNKIDLMGRGDILLLYTDGLLDLMNGQEEMFFPARLEEIFRKTKSLPPREICAAVRREIFDFSDDIGDDITYVIIKKQ